MRTYRVMPSELKASGPKGFILKSDVLAHIESNKLQKGVRLEPKKPEAKVEPAAQKPAAGKKP
jgi:hypothetical protein